MQKQEMIKLIMIQYAERTPITQRGISLLYDRALARGYSAGCIYMGLKQLFAKIILGKSISCHEMIQY